MDTFGHIIHQGMAEVKVFDQTKYFYIELSVLKLFIFPDLDVLVMMSQLKRNCCPRKNTTLAFQEFWTLQ